MKVAASWFLPINTLTLLALFSHLLFDLHACITVKKLEHLNTSEEYNGQLVDSFIIKVLHGGSGGFDKDNLI